MLPARVTAVVAALMLANRANAAGETPRASPSLSLHAPHGPAARFLNPADFLIDPAAVSASGLSSGADLVVQLQVAYSSLFAGIGVFAGQSYHCAVHRFPGDAVVPANSTKDSKSIPYCDGCPPGDTLAVYDHCKVQPNVTSDPAPLVAYARAQDAAGTIDGLGNLTNAGGSLKNKRIYLYRGTDDEVYHHGSVDATANFFRSLLPASGANDVFFETRINSSHLLPGIDPYLCWWEEWDGTDNCTYDGARHVLEWVYGADALAGGRDNDTDALGRQLQLLAQRPFFPADGRDPLMAEDALVYAPPQCRASSRGGSSSSGGDRDRDIALANRAADDREDPGIATGVAAGDLCKLHLFFHGCGVEPTYPVFSHYGGFLEWAVRLAPMFLSLSARLSWIECSPTVTVVFPVLPRFAGWHV